MATAASSGTPHRSLRRVFAAGALAALAAGAAAFAVGCGSSGPSGSSAAAGAPGAGAASGAGGSGAAVSARVALPAGWRTARTASGDSTLAYPPGWSRGQSDAGTVSVYLDMSAAGIPRGYLNVTPQQGDESLSNWRSSRLAHNREEGDRQVTLLSSGSRRIGAATANCVSDVYGARVGGRHWHELACFVQGPQTGAVFVGAAQPRDWPALAPLIQRSLMATVQR